MVRTITVQQRRRRLARRHRLIGSRRTSDLRELTRSVVCLHATDPATVYLSAWARGDGFTADDLDRALYRDRTLVKQLAMRRTLFVVDRDDLDDVVAGAGDRVAAAESRRVVREVEKTGLFDDGERWLAGAKQAVLEALAGGREATSTELREEIPALRGSIPYGVGKSWAADVPIGPRVLTVLSAEGRIVRASNRGDWTTSRPRWAAMEDWIGRPLERRPDAHTRLVRRWLSVFGPGTAEDVKWWLGSTVAAVKRSLAELGAVEVDCDGTPGYLLPDDRDGDRDLDGELDAELDAGGPVEPWTALLPGLDPTIMGWADRDWYIEPEHRALIFDRNGNAGPSVWCDGRVVGGWWQSEDGEVQVRLLTDIGAEATAAVQQQAAELTHWLGGRRILPRFPSPLAKMITEQG